MEELTLMQKFSDPQLFEQLSNGDKATGALITTLMGMGITFIILGLLWGVIALMAKIINATEKKPQLAAAAAGASAVTASTNVGAQNTVAMAATQSSATGSNASTTLDPKENAELVAVIMAAIAASEGSEFVNNLVVRKINRMAGNPPAWGRQGGLDCIESRKF